MALSDLFKKKEKNPAAAIDLTKNPELNRKISLRKDIVIDEVKRQNISSDTARVVFILDHSGSMRKMYRDGTVQEVLERIFPIAMHFDDNGELEFYWFDSVFKELEPVTAGNLEGYVNNVILSANDHFGGTNYAPVMHEITERYAVREPAPIPTFVIFLTDGNNADKRAAKDELIRASGFNIFWKFVGMGNEKFDFLAKLDDLDGRFIDNANFIRIADAAAADERELYSLLLTEYGGWLGLCRANGITVG